MIDEKLVIEVVKLVNTRIERKFPVLGDNYFKTADTKYLLQAFIDIMKVLEYTKEKNGNNTRKTKIQTIK
jgi:hypothetical protein